MDWHGIMSFAMWQCQWAVWTWATVAHWLTGLAGGLARAVGGTLAGPVSELAICLLDLAAARMVVCASVCFMLVVSCILAAKSAIYDCLVHF